MNMLEKENEENIEDMKSKDGDENYQMNKMKKMNTQMIIDHIMKLLNYNVMTQENELYK